MSLSSPVEEKVQGLKPKSVGLISVLFMVLATAAPITAVTGGLPVVIGYGNGTGAPGVYLVAMIVLFLFSIGFVQMTKHITTTSAFYGFISHGMGRIMGLASGFLSVIAYIVFEAAIVGVFASFAATTVETQFGISIHWFFYALVMILLNAILSYFNINMAAKVLSVFLVLELGILVLLTISIFAHGGGPDGIPWSTVNPMNAFKGVSPAVGLIFAFFSWVGFESTAIYGEESHNPKKVIRLATYIAVLGVGIFYILVSLAIISGNGLAETIALAQNADDPFAMVFTPTQQYLGTWAVYVWQWLLITGSFACGLAFHNCAARYIYSLGREQVIHRKLGNTHKVHGSPYIASFAQSGITLLIILLYVIFKQDPYISLYTMMGDLGTLIILLVQALCSFAVIAYFIRNRHLSRNWFTTFVAPLLGGIGMLYIIFLLISNFSVAGGAIANLLMFKLLPWLVLVVFVVGILTALYLRARRPQKYAILGRIIFEEASERPVVPGE
jgi:amino acid transporter